MSTICSDCHTAFVVTEQERLLLERIAANANGSAQEFSTATQCPSCRSRQRCAFRNQRTLHRRICDLCKKPHITLYAEDVDAPVYCQHCFFSDQWDAADYGQAYDSDKSFLEQLAELHQRTPRLGIMNKQSENSDYCNYSFSNKNCYLVFSSHYEEDCLYGNCSTKDRNCFDYHWLENCELCYESLFSANCYRCVSLDHCTDCNDCSFSVDLRSCKNCLFCANLQHAEYCIFNQQYSQEEYNKRLAEYRLHTASGFAEARRIFTEEVRRLTPFRSVYQLNCESCEGNNLVQSKQLTNCYEANYCEECCHSTYLGSTVSSVDVSYMGFDRCELCYQCIGCTALYRGIACDSCWHGSALSYCSYCFSSNSLFGCLSLQRKEHHILNFPYSKDDYLQQTSQIIAELQEQQCWGNFFPKQLSQFSYGETVAQEWFPLDSAAAAAVGYHWQEKEVTVPSTDPTEVADDIADVSEDIVQQVLCCVDCSKNYKVAQAEFSFYRDRAIPIPRNCPDCRQKRRIELHHPWKLWERSCQKCNQPTKSVFEPQGIETVYCESCYFAERS